MPLADDVRRLLHGFGSVPVVVGAVHTRGVADVEEVVETDGMGGAVAVRRRTVRLAAAEAGSAIPGASITVDGVAGTVVDAHRQDDGLVVRVIVR